MYVRLPEIQDELERSIVKTETELEGLPIAPGNDPLAEIMNLIHRFTIDISRHAEGCPVPGGLLQTIRPAYMQFRHSIKGTAPEFMPFSKASGKTIKAPDFLTNEDGDVEKGHDPRFIYYLDEVMDKAQE